MKSKFFISEVKKIEYIENHCSQITSNISQLKEDLKQHADNPAVQEIIEQLEEQLPAIENEPDNGAAIKIIEHYYCNLAKALSKLGKLLYAKRNIETAISMYDQTIQHDPASEKASTRPDVAFKTLTNSSLNLYETGEITSLLKKYSLPDSSQAALERGLRIAATNNKIGDLGKFIKYVKNIDAQDTNMNVRRTALHWAAVKGHNKCCKLLLDAGASVTIPDARNETAEMYLNLNSAAESTNTFV